MPSARAKRPGATASGERRAAAIPSVRTQGAGDAIAVRHYGTSGPFVALLHGGPGAAGYLAPLARELDDCFRVLEPLQRSAGRAPLSVASHLADLHQVLERDCAGALPLLVGHSWGAMLALAYAAARPRKVRGLVLIGCGTFDPVSRARLQATVEQRVDAALRQRLERLPLDLPDPDARLRQLGNLLLPVYSYETAVTELAATSCDARAHDESWRDMLRLQEAGVYPAAFAAIEAPVLMLHGAVDPHPGALIRDALRPHLPELEYRELERCGHYPWLERGRARDDFVAALRRWLAEAGRGEKM